MIKVIATDLDGTLLDENHTLNQITYEALLGAQKQGIRTMIASGRDYAGATATLGNHELTCDYVVASGAELRNPQGELLHFITMEPSCFSEIIRRVGDMPVLLRFCSKGCDYVIGRGEDLPNLMLKEAKLFFSNEGDDESIKKSVMFQNMLKRIQSIDSLETLLKREIPVFKVFISAQDDTLIPKVEALVADIPNIVSASSFANNTELTHINAQKGPVLKNYIEELGYTMEEVMVLGDSMNDYSMLSMDFGATVAMENAMPKVKRAAKYITKPNTENGVAYVINELLEGRLEKLRVNS